MTRLCWRCTCALVLAPPPGRYYALSRALSRASIRASIRKSRGVYQKTQLVRRQVPGLHTIDRGDDMTDKTLTQLDTCHAVMAAVPDDDAARLRYFAALADAMLFVMLEVEASGGTVSPQMFDLEDGPVVLAFDLEERLAEAAGAAVPYAELPGRVIAQQLAGQGVALGVNLGVADSGFLVSPEALTWLARTLESSPSEIAARPVSFHAPRGLPEALIAALKVKLARASGLAVAALLAGVRYDDGRQGHMLAYLGAAPGAEGALARAAGEALTFSGGEAGGLDVTFLNAEDAGLAAMARVALRFDLPEPVRHQPSPPQAPGTDPEKPPILR
mgnify:CR=1 FL=1